MLNYIKQNSVGTFRNVDVICHSLHGISIPKHRMETI